MTGELYNKEPDRLVNSLLGSLTPRQPLEFRVAMAFKYCFDTQILTDHEIMSSLTERQRSLLHTFSDGYSGKRLLDGDRETVLTVERKFRNALRKIIRIEWRRYLGHRSTVKFFDERVEQWFNSVKLEEDPFNHSANEGKR